MSRSHISLYIRSLYLYLPATQDQTGALRAHKGRATAADEVCATMGRVVCAINDH